MNKNILFFILVLMVLLSLFFVLISDKEDRGEEVLTEEQAIEEVGVGFINNFLLIAPPSEDEEAMERALNTLSERALGEIGAETQSRDLALFVGVQDIPDNGFEVKDIVIKDANSAILEVELKYSSGSAHKDIHFVKEEGKWKIDSVEGKPVADFNEVGNIVRNNPGYPEGVWFLVYEEPGSPALSKALSFTDDSLCIKEEGFICDPDELEEGERVEIEGVDKEGEVEVMTLRYVN